MDSVQHSMMEMTATFNKKMAEFQRDLQNLSSNNSQPASNSPTSKLAAEFNAFQSFVLSSLKTLQTQITFLSNQFNKLEMRSRRKILLIHGVPEDSKELPSKLAIKILTDHLKNLDLTEDAISRCHRLGVSKKDKPRPIVIKFKDAVMRNSIWYAKTDLKGSGFTLSEFLTKDRHDVFVAARARFGITNCWTKEGFIFVQLADGAKQRISVMADLDNIPSIHASSSPGATGSTSNTHKGSKLAQNVRPKRPGRAK
ncbi:uncharacterized protein LOC123700901 [Colias croceus]|uniref:uncharacterized protein LOC123700901 n=1 Tax=Colias crocea TaxID=72248 RepID=UPI001E27A9F0|nr:uncharacterized protein LOC123700901 [Colias croceus]